MARRSAPARTTADRGGSGGSGSRPRRRDAEVLDTAADVFHDKGYASATVQDVADALGMLKGSLYYYIESKEDLLYRLINEIHDGVDEVLDDVVGRDDLTPIQRLDQYVRSQVEYNVRNLVKISVYYHDLDQLSGDRLKEIVARRRVHENQVVDWIKQAQEAGDADSTIDPKLLGNFVFATIIWIYRWYRPNGGTSAQRLGDACARYALNGLNVPKRALKRRAAPTG